MDKCPPGELGSPGGWVGGHQTAEGWVKLLVSPLSLAVCFGDTPKRHWGWHQWRSRRLFRKLGDPDLKQCPQTWKTFGPDPNKTRTGRRCSRPG